MTVAAVKQKLMSHTGSSPSSMQLQLKDETGRLLGQMSDDSRLLGFYSPYDGYTSIERTSKSLLQVVICVLCLDRLQQPPGAPVCPQLLQMDVSQVYCPRNRYRCQLQVSSWLAGRHQQGPKVCHVG